MRINLGRRPAFSSSVSSIAGAVSVVGFMVASLVWTPGARADGGAISRSLLRAPATARDLPPEERFALCWQLADRSGMEEALNDSHFPSHLREWARARLLVREGDRKAALDALVAASSKWPRDGHREAYSIRLAFDRQRIRTAVEAQDRARVAVFGRDFRSDPDDPILVAWLAWADSLRTEPSELSAALQRAWSRASATERRDPVFLRRALAELRAGHRPEAAAAWLECIAALSRPDERRNALAFWDDHPQLASIWDSMAQRLEVGRWLARSVRRPQALDLVQAGLATAEGEDAAQAFAFVAEQFYRLRRNEDLERWLARPWPEGLDDEERAELRAVPLGAARRAGSSVELARSFEGVARDFPETRRSVEALWEAAWMYELSGEVDEAIRVYDEYVRRSPKARYASDAAVRGLLLRSTRGDALSALTRRFEEIEPVLGEGAARASALWLLMRAARRADAAVDELRWEEALEDMEGPVPLLGPVSVEGSSKPLDPRRLHERQRRAFDHLRQALGGDRRHDAGVRAGAELLRLGLVEEAERLLLQMVRDRVSDTRLLFDVAEVGWRYGSPEIQARVGFLLRRRMQDDGSELQEDLWVISRPTPFFDATVEAARDFGLQPEILWAIMRRESFYDPDVVSVAGARGLIQLMPATASRIAEKEGWERPDPEELFRPGPNLRFGAEHLREHLDEFEGNAFLSLAAYNAGPRMARRWRDRIPPGSPPAQVALLISYTETRAYVYDVLRNARIYRDLYRGR